MRLYCKVARNHIRYNIASLPRKKFNDDPKDMRFIETTSISVSAGMRHSRKVARLLLPKVARDSELATASDRVLIDIRYNIALLPRKKPNVDSKDPRFIETTSSVGYRYLRP